MNLKPHAICSSCAQTVPVAPNGHTDAWSYNYLPHKQRLSEGTLKNCRNVGVVASASVA